MNALASGRIIRSTSRPLGFGIRRTVLRKFIYSFGTVAVPISCVGNTFHNYCPDRKQWHTFSNDKDIWFRPFSSSNDSEIRKMTIESLEKLEAQAKTPEDYHAVIKGYVELGDPAEAETILTKMEEGHLVPLAESYATIVRSWKDNCLTVGAPRRAQSLAEKLESTPTMALAKREEDASTLQLLTYTYNDVIETWSESNEHMFASHAHEVFETMDMNGIPRNKDTYSLVLHTWSKCKMKVSAYKATEILQKMEKLAFRDPPDPQMIPSLEDYKSVLRSWPHSKDPLTSARRALTILNRMEDSYKSEKSHVRPDMECYKYVLEALSKTSSGEMPFLESSRLLQRMDDLILFPDATCFEHVIATCGRSSHADAAPKADELLEQMEDMYRRGSLVEPNSKSYQDALLAWSRSHSALAGVKAEEILERMTELHKSGAEGLRPTPGIYTAAIDCWKNSKDRDKIEKAESILHRMDDPTIDAYNALLTVCASPTKSDRDALLSAIRTTSTIKQKGVRPNTKTYKLLLKACSLYLPEGNERSKALQNIFKKCCRDGFLDSEIVRMFRDASPLDIRRKYLRSEDGAMHLPLEWSRNCKEKTGFGIDAVIGFDGTLIVSPREEKRMRKLRNKTNQKLLRGGRVE